MYSTVILLTLVAIASCHDLILGNNTAGRKIYDQVSHASPAIWKQSEIVTINTTDCEVISRIVITDLRPDKDGEVHIVEGGEGHKNVTLELKSPTMLRGFDFQIQVFTIPENNVQHNKKVDTPAQTKVPQKPTEDLQKPALSPPRAVRGDQPHKPATKTNTTPITGDTKVNIDTKTTNKDSEDVKDHKLSTGPEPFVGKQPSNIPTTTPHDKEEAKNGQVRQTRDALNPKVTEETQSLQKQTFDIKGHTKVEDPLPPHPAITSNHQGTKSPLSVSAVSTTIKPEDVNATKRDSRQTEHDKKNDKTKPDEHTSIQHPAINTKNIIKPTPVASTTQKPTNIPDGPRETRNTEHEKKDDCNPATKTGVKSTHPAHHKISCIPEVKTVTPSVVQPSHPSKNGNENTKSKPHDHTVSPHGVINSGNEGIIKIGVESEKKPINPTLSNNAEKKDEPNKTNDAAKSGHASTTIKPITDNHEGVKTQVKGHIPQYQPLPYTTTTIAPVKSDNKRETETQEATLHKIKEGDFKTVHRDFGEHSATVTEPKPVKSTH